MQKEIGVMHQNIVKECGKCCNKKSSKRFCFSNWKTASVRNFVELAFRELNIEIIWEGSGINEVGVNKKTGKIVIKIDKNYYRPTEVNILQGDFSKAKNY